MAMDRHRLRRFMVLLPMLVAWRAVADPAGLEITGAWLDEPPPGRSAAAIYMTLRNHATEALTVTGARTEAAASAALHGHSRHAGMVRMHVIERLEIPPGGTLVLAPGGSHLMLVGVHASTVPGTSLPFCLLVEGRGEVCAEAQVRQFGE